MTETRGFHPVEDRVVAGEADEIALHFEPDDPALRHPRRQAQHRRPGAAADIENKLMRLGRHRGGEKHRIDRDARSRRPAAAAVPGRRGDGPR